MRERETVGYKTFILLNVWNKITFTAVIRFSNGMEKPRTCTSTRTCAALPMLTIWFPTYAYTDLERLWKNGGKIIFIYKDDHLYRHRSTFKNTHMARALRRFLHSMSKISRKIFAFKYRWNGSWSSLFWTFGILIFSILGIPTYVRRVSRDRKKN